MKKFRIILVLDRSGSMCGVTDVTIQGVNELIRSTRNISSVLKVPVNFTFIGFEDDSEFMEGYKDVSVDNIKQVTGNEIFARGGTQMYDAMSFMFEKTEDIVTKDEIVLVAVFSDGCTGGDRTSPKDVASAVKSSKGWTFAFVGANQDAEESATKMGFPKTNAMEYRSDSLGTRSAFFKLSRAIRYWMESNAASKKPKTKDFFFDDDLKKSVMKVNGATLTLNMPEAILSKDEDNKLPPYAPVAAYVVDEYPACPSNWEHGSAKASSYFVSAKEGHGMWFDFNDNLKSDYDYAAVLSIQGVNPITGTPTNLPLRLEKYDNKCPLHDEDFKQDRFCDKCGFKWPTQNFISSSACPLGQFWLDGFRTPDGKVRQYVFTEESARGVATALIGEDRVFAIGVAFYKSKKKRPEVLAQIERDKQYKLMMKRAKANGGTVGYSGYSGYSGVSGFSGSAGITGQGYMKGMTLGSKLGSNQTYSQNRVSAQSLTRGFLRDASSNASVIPRQGKVPESNVDSVDQTVYCLSSDSYDGPIGAADMGASAAAMAFDEDVVTEKKFEVGAGAKIEQAVHADPNSLDYWEESPLGIIYINYTTEEHVKRILHTGKRKEVEEGFLNNIPVGN